LPIPRGPVSVISAPGGPFHDPAADAELFGAIRAHLLPRVPVIELECDVNDPAFSRACAEALLRNMAAQSSAQTA